jgi:adenine-specific DNA-methyltransferase
MIKEGRILWKETLPKQKEFMREMKNENMAIKSNWGVFDAQSTTVFLKELLPNIKFPNPKPIGLMEYLIKVVTSKDAIILDSFAGSGTTAQAVLKLNKEDGGNRKFILVEMEKEIAQKITSERVRRVSKDLKGHFSYEVLAEPLFNANGTITEEVSYNAFAQYIYFTETHTNLNTKQITNPKIGELNEIEYYLIYKKPKENLLDKSFLKNIKKNKIQKVVYADKNVLSDVELSEYGIVFKQIPYEVKVY